MLIPVKVKKKSIKGKETERGRLLSRNNTKTSMKNWNYMITAELCMSG